MAADSVHMMQPFVQESSRKRGRDGDNDAAGLMGFSEHRNKRVQRLPLRTSPHKMWPNADYIEPLFSTPSSQSIAESDPLDLYRQSSSHFSPWSSSIPSHKSASQRTDDSGDVDMDMDMDIGAAPPTNTRCDGTGGTGGTGGTSDPAHRLPTPIQPNFATQVRGSSWGGGPGPALNHLNGVTSLGHEPSRLGLATEKEGMANRLIPRSMEAEDKWAQSRRLPSPISEGDDSSPNLTGQSDMSPAGMVLDGGFLDFSRPQGHLCSTGGVDEQVEMEPASETHTLHHPDHPDHADPDDGPPAELASPTLPISPTSPTSHRKGHSRSRHTVNSWTWQPGMKKSFSIGYRADCEKCRQKVPGHFNHIIIS